ncbi:MAG: 30S ribosomal protein S20 [Parcubacteria group bacterium]|nr:30S ribosomal protein S20 [Parcubacteria group bacterium]
MPITRSAKKAVKTSATKKTFNDRRRRAMREAVKSVRASVKDNSAESAAKLSDAYKAIDKAAKRGVIKKNTAARKKSRLAATIAKASK